MPASGDQHARTARTSSTGINQNPFELPEPSMSRWTAQEIAMLQSRLDRRLGPEYLSTRPGAGGQKLHYLTGATCINLANEVFGFNGWSSSIQNITIDDVRENPNTGKCSVALSVIVRVTLRDGTYHEDIGYGHGDNYKERASAFEKAKKEGTTDALKRALRTFGNVLGNCIYEKDYLAQISRIKVPPVKHDIDSLHRQPQYAPKRQPSTARTSRAATNRSEKPEGDNLAPPVQHNLPTPLSAPQQETPQQDASMDEVAEDVDIEAEFGSDLFEDEAELDSEEFVDPETVGVVQDTSSISIPDRRPTLRPNDHQFVTPSKPNRPRPMPKQAPLAANSTGPPIQPRVEKSTAKPSSSTELSAPPPGMLSSQDADTTESTEEITEDKRPPDPSGGFYSARAADALRTNPYEAPKSARAFDPRFASPSIRKTPGFDHTTSAPIARKSLDATTPLTTEAQEQIQDASQEGNLDETPVPARRQVAATPMGRGGGGMTSSYKPPRRAMQQQGEQQPKQQQLQQNVNAQKRPAQQQGQDATHNRDPSKRHRIDDS